MKHLLYPSLVALLACSGTPNAFAGSTSLNFDVDPTGILDFTGTSTWRPSGGVGGSGYLSITDALNGQAGKIVFDELEPGLVINSFIFSADLRTGGGTADPADGYSVSFVREGDPVLVPGIGATEGFAGTAGEPANLPEEGTRTGVSIGLDEWFSGDATPGVPDVIGISVRVDGVLVNQTPLPTKNGSAEDVTSLQTGPAGVPVDGSFDVPGHSFVNLTIQMKEDGKLSVSYKGLPILTDLQTTFAPSRGRIVLAGRTGGANAHHHVDNISITTTSANKPLLTGTPMTANTATGVVTNAPGINIDITKPYTMTVDGTSYPVVATQTGSDTMFKVTTAPPALFAAGNHEIVITTRDTSNTLYTFTRTATLAPYTLMETAWKAQAGQVDTSEPSFLASIHQLNFGRYPGDANAIPLPDRQLADGYYDAGLPGIAQNVFNPLAVPPGAVAQPDGTFIIPGVLNWDQDGFNQGNFNGTNGYPETLIPGIPGMTGSTDNVVGEIFTWIQLPAGSTTFGVNSDDGFTFAVGSTALDHFTRRVAGQFSGGRGASDTTFTVAAPTAGLYPVRLLWWEGGGGANLEFFSLDEAGNRVLVNDAGNPASLKAYYAGLPAKPSIHGIAPFPSLSFRNDNRHPVRIELIDGVAAVQDASIVLTVDGKAYKPTIENAGIRTRVSMGPVGPGGKWTKGLHRLSLSFSDATGASRTESWAFFADGEQFFQAPFGPGGKWRIYEVVRAGANFKDALADARSRRDPVTGTVAGDLASVTSAEKNRFLHRTLGFASEMWIGLTDREGAAPGAQESQTFGNPGNYTNGWAWTNGDPFSFNVWGPGEPNDWAGTEDAGHLRGDGMWNDNRSGFGFDDPMTPEVQPGTSNDEGGGPGLIRVVEYKTDSVYPVPGIRYGAVLPPAERLPLPRNSEGNWSVREIRGVDLAGNIMDAVDVAMNTGLRSFDAQVPYLDFADPQTNGNGGPMITTPVMPYLSNDYTGAGTADDNIVVLATTKLNIPTTGDYTFQVRADDGFALRIRGSAFSAVNGDGYIDPLDPSTIVFERGTGDANTRGVIRLAAGQHDVDFVTWEGGGGAYYEVTTATGARLTVGEARQWLPLGSNTFVPELNSVNAVSLKTPAQVANANLRDRGNVLPAMRAIIDKAIANGSATTDVRSNLELGEGDMPNNNGGDNYITKVTGSITLTADADGNGTAGESVDVTFGLYCDDGASLRILGQDFAAAQGDGNTTLIDNGGDATLTADFYTGNTNARGRIRLVEGATYQFVSYMYEGGGGSNYNLRWQVGDWVTGLTAPTALRTVDVAELAGVSDPVWLASPATVSNSNNGFGPPFLADTRNIMREAVAQGVTDNGTTAITVLRDGGENICCGRPGNNIYSQATVMPNGGPDNYATRVTGRFVVNNQNGIPGETIRLTFGIFADDGCELRIVGQDFLTAFDTTGDGVAGLADINDDVALQADYWTGNTQAFGTIDLVEGEYDFEGHHFEGGGGSGFEIWFADGDQTGLNANFRPVTTNSGFYLPPNTGIGLAPTPNPDLDNDGIPGFWETAFGMSDSNAADAVTDTDGDGQTAAQEYAAGTAPNDPNSAFRITNIAFIPGQISLTFPGVVGRGYEVVSSATLNGDWVPVGQVLPRTTDGPITFPVTNPALVDAAARGKVFFAVIAKAYP